VTLWRGLRSILIGMLMREILEGGEDGDGGGFGDAVEAGAAGKIIGLLCALCEERARSLRPRAVRFYFLFIAPPCSSA
jgi:hypothetical protein